MLLEYRRGILFIRLNGSLNKNTKNELESQVNKIIKENQIRNVVLNLEKLNEIDIKGINLLFYIYELTRNNKGRIFMCNLTNDIKQYLKKNRILNYIKEIDNELIAFDLVEI